MFRPQNAFAEPKACIVDIIHQEKELQGAQILMQTFGPAQEIKDHQRAADPEQAITGRRYHDAEDGGDQRQFAGTIGFSEAQIIFRQQDQENAEGEYSVSLEIREGKGSLLSATLSVPTEEQAQIVCNNWRSSNQKVYEFIMKELLRD